MNFVKPSSLFSAAAAATFATLTTFASTASAQASLENPQPSSFQSGIGIISGWSCTSGVQVVIDGTPLAVAYGTPRGDVASTCGGNSNVGFGLLTNYNTLGNGTHTAQLRVNGTNVGAAVPFTVTVPQGEFPIGLAGTVTINNFPSAGKSTTLQWQQSQQNFAISSVSNTGGNPGTGGFPITFKGFRLDGITYKVDEGPSCEAKLSYTNTTSAEHTGAFYFDVIQGGVVKDQVIFAAASVGAGVSKSEDVTVTVNGALVACGAFTLQFNSSDSIVF